MNNYKTKDQKGLAAEVVVFGVVQGVGFRPFIYRLAHEFHYKGWVKNIGFGVEIHVESKEKADFKDFLKALQEKKPPLSQIEEIIHKTASFQNVKDFTIKKSKKGIAAEVDRVLMKRNLYPKMWKIKL